MERTLVVIKPDGVRRNLIGEIIKRYEEKGLKIIALKMLHADEELVKKHYPNSMIRVLGEKSAKAGTHIDNIEEHGRKVLSWLRNFITSGPVVAMILEGEDAVKLVRKITGYTDPSEAEQGTIRGDLGIDSIKKANEEQRPVYNLVHASGSPEEAKKEIKIWFPELC